MTQHRTIFLGMSVKYTGQGRTIPKSSVGVVVGYVRNVKDEVVVEFGSDTYIVNQSNLKTHSFSEKEKGPETIKLIHKNNE